ncbi:MAG: hypothetical protein AAGA18_08315 [Verrucomicrobiota bacterium]
MVITLIRSNNCLRGSYILFAFVFCLQITQLHLHFAQLYAWGQMLPDYYKATNSWSLALDQTLDGQHPCKMCERIEETRHSDQEQRSVTSLQAFKFQALFISYVPYIPLALSGERLRVLTCEGLVITEPPLSPPPELI